MNQKFIRELKVGERNIGIIGMGYVGLSLLEKLVDAGYKCVGFDIDKSKINLLKQGEDPTGTLKAKNINKYCSFATNMEVIQHCSVLIVCVQTPISSIGEPDYTYMDSAIESIAKYMVKNTLVIIESSVGVGKTEYYGNILAEKSKLNLGIDFEIGFSPERVMPGTTNEFTKIIAGSPSVLKVMKAIYKTIFEELHECGIKEAEAAKLFENSQKDWNIAFMNYLKIWCEEMEVDHYQVMEAMSSRQDSLKYKPGLVGGHCIPVDPYFIQPSTKMENILMLSRSINEEYWEITYHKLLNLTKDHKIGWIGITYKPNVSDTRNSGSLKLCNALIYETKWIMVYDEKDINFERNVFTPTEISTECTCIVYAVQQKTDIKKFIGNGTKRVIDLTGTLYYRKLEIEKLGVELICL
jgi:UDP-N-acetyl-D-glucosamine/UDP-N-acetyl-D-galactosamine dehydrogenase